MNQKSVVIILVMIVAALLFIVVSSNRQPNETITPEPTPSLESGVVETETVDQAEPEATTDIDVVPQRPQGKIDVRVACESALMYTTFADGAAADVFIEECIAGDHPEVIERYLSDMNVDGAMI